MPDDTSTFELQKSAAILLVSNNGELDSALRGAITRSPHNGTVESATSLGTARKCIEQTTFDLMFIDLLLPDGDVLGIVSHISNQTNKAVSVATSNFDDDANILRAFRAGAHGYLTDHSARQLDKNLEDLFNGRPPVSPVILRRVLNLIRKDIIVGVPGLTLKELTKREQEVLTLISKGLTTPKIAVKLGLSKNTVAHHVKAIYAKLRVHNRAEATSAAFNLGLVHRSSSL